MNCCINDVNFIRLLLLSTSYLSLKSKDMVKFYVYISPIFSYRVTYIGKYKHACMYSPGGPK